MYSHNFISGSHCRIADLNIVYKVDVLFTTSFAIAD